MEREVAQKIVSENPAFVSPRSFFAIAVPYGFYWKSPELVIRVTVLLVLAALAPWGRLDAMVNNAATYPEDSALTGPDAELGVFASNAVAPWRLAQAARRALVLTDGAVVNLVDNCAAQSNVIPGRAIYGASKAALLSLTFSLAREFAPKVRVNAVAPGMILPTTGEDEWTEEDRLAMSRRVLLGANGKPASIAEAVLFMATATHITGQALVVDGGEGLAW